MALMSIEKERYLLGGGVTCPFCGSEDTEGGSFEADTGYVYQEVKCNGVFDNGEDCGKRWKDIYSLVDMEEVI